MQYIPPLRIIFASVMMLTSWQIFSDITVTGQQKIKQDESAKLAIYEVELLDWKNLSGKTVTGRKYVSTVITGNDAHVNEARSTWAIKAPMRQWQKANKDSYDDVDDVEKIGIARLAMVPQGETHDVILRVQVLNDENERDFKTAKPGYFIRNLPATSDISCVKVNHYEQRSEAIWSSSIDCFSAAHLNKFLAVNVDYEAQRDQELIVRFRADHEGNNIIWALPLLYWTLSGGFGKKQQCWAFIGIVFLCNVTNFFMVAGQMQVVYRQSVTITTNYSAPPVLPYYTINRLGPSNFAPFMLGMGPFPGLGYGLL